MYSQLPWYRTLLHVYTRPLPMCDGCSCQHTNAAYNMRELVQLPACSQTRSSYICADISGTAKWKAVRSIAAALSINSDWEIRPSPSVSNLLSNAFLTFSFHSWRLLWPTPAPSNRLFACTKTKLRKHNTAIIIGQLRSSQRTYFSIALAAFLCRSISDLSDPELRIRRWCSSICHIATIKHVWMRIRVEGKLTTGFTRRRASIAKLSISSTSM